MVLTEYDYGEEFRTHTINDIYKNMMLYKKQAKMRKGSVMLDNLKGKL